MRYIRKKAKEYELESEIPILPGGSIKIVYKFTENYKKIRTFTEVTSVSLNIKIGNDWVTILYYDNTHEGILHRHLRIVWNNESEIPLDGFTMNGTPEELLTWAINDLTVHFMNYIEYFIDRNPEIKDKIDIY